MKKKSELTQKEIADFCGVTQGCVSGWFSGKLVPRLKNVLKLKKLGFPLEIWNDKVKFDGFMQDLQDEKNFNKMVMKQRKKILKSYTKGENGTRRNL